MKIQSKRVLRNIFKEYLFEKNIKQRDARYNNKQLKWDCIIGWEKRIIENEIVTEYAVEEEIVFEEI